MVGAFPVPLIQVQDTLRALGDLAAARRRNFSGPVVGLTGSAGKTTTKEMLAGILSLTGPGLKTEGNFNNLIGLPRITSYNVCYTKLLRATCRSSSGTTRAAGKVATRTSR